MSYPDGDGPTGLAQVDPELFAKLVSELKGQKDTMALAAWVRQPGAGGYGGSPIGRLLAHHTELARGHVVTGVHEVSAALDAYVSGLTYYKTGMDDTDAQSNQAFTTIQATTSQVTTALNQNTPDNSTPVAPTLPSTNPPGVDQ